MSGNGIGNTPFNIVLLKQQLNAGQGANTTTAADGGVSFASSMAMKVAEFQAQTVSTLLGSSLGSESSKPQSGIGGVDINALLGLSSSATDALGAAMPGNPTSATGAVGGIGGLSPTGRNLALFDPESAYRMMSVINDREVVYKAQFSALSEMKSAVGEMQQNGENLGKISSATSDSSLRLQLQVFTEQFNQWTKRFDGAMQPGGLLAGTQAAQVSRYELRASVENIFFGAYDGLRGMGDLGLKIDPVSKLASLDLTRLDQVLGENRQGAINTIQEFALNFAKSAELLNSPGNFIPNRLGNIERAIDYIDSNKSSLQAEFGLGDPAKPNDQVAQALAAYQKMASV